MEFDMKPCNFTFDDSPEFPGFAYGTTWNGFDNVAVTLETHQDIIVWLEETDSDEDTLTDFRAMKPEQHENGMMLVSYAMGYATQIAA
jgi:hypothetical protein